MMTAMLKHTMAVALQTQGEVLMADAICMQEPAVAGAPYMLAADEVREW